MIVYFSGTGNSKWVAHLLGELMSKEVVAITSLSPTSFGKVEALVFPIYAWGMPRWIAAYLDSTTLPEAIDIIVTCGDDIGMTDACLKRYLSKRHCNLRSCHSVQMPNTYVALPGFDVDSEEVVCRKMKNALQRLQVIARRLLRQEEKIDVVRGLFPRLKSYVLRPIFNMFLTGDSRFKVDEQQCINCTKCEKACPVQNITMSDEGLPVWLHHCADCAACFHVCPKHAIEHNVFTKNKGQKTIL